METAQEAEGNTKDGKGTVMLLLTVLVEGSTIISPDNPQPFDEVNDRLVAAITQVVGKVPGQLGWIKTDLTQLDAPKTNSGQCVVCGYWVTDCEKPDPLRGLYNGATVDGQLLCERHLPPDHPWAN